MTNLGEALPVTLHFQIHDMFPSVFSLSSDRKQRAVDAGASGFTLYSIVEGIVKGTEGYSNQLHFYISWKIQEVKAAMGKNILYQKDSWYTWHIFIS